MNKPDYEEDTPKAIAKVFSLIFLLLAIAFAVIFYPEYIAFNDAITRFSTNLSHLVFSVLL